MSMRISPAPAVVADREKAGQRWEHATRRLHSAAIAILACRHPRILIADDNEDFAALLAVALERRGATARVAQNEMAAREWLHATRFDLVIVDGCDWPEERVPALFVSATPDGRRKPYICKAEGAEAVADAALAVIGK